MTLAAKLDRVRVKLADKSPKFMFDTADLLAPVKSTQGAGHTITDEVVASDVWLTYEQLSSGLQVEVDGVSRTTTHRLTIQGLDEALLIDHHYKIKVHARDPNPELIFENPVREIESFTPFVVVQAVLTQGVRRPGTR